jgi:hypothetical protein
MNSVTKQILQKVEGWPEEDQQELAELAREIEARRTGVYELSDEERTVIADARRGAFASDEEAAAFWKRTYRATTEELCKIDEALAAARRGEIATGTEVEAVFVKHRRA